jgi:leucyl aminopeptidase
MQWTSFKNVKERKSADVLLLPFWQGKKSAEAAFKAGTLAPLIKPPLTANDFHGKEGEMLVLYNAKKGEKRILFIGLGSKQECNAENLRRAYAAAVKQCRRKKWAFVNLVVPESIHLKEEAVCQSIAEGMLLANYAFDALKHDAIKEEPTVLLSKVCLIGVEKESLALCKKTEKITTAVELARDLVNGNADDVNASALVKCAKELEREFSHIKVKILDKKQLEKEKMGLLLAVNRAAAHDPALIILEYRGDEKSKEQTAFVGKGITFDTGGLNMKQTGQMETMKCDMAGAAAVLGVIRAAASLGLKKNVIGVIAAAENAVGPSSFKPGDVYRSYSGKTIEISNTDAEGRLVLADALSYLQATFEPTRIIDLATLTGGIVITLGEEVTGLFCNDDALACSLIAAGEKTYERLWRLPLYKEYKEALKSSIADLKNSGGRKASSITAALFLEQFIKKTPWAHLDIAGTAYLSDPKTYNPTNATGVGVRLLIEFLENL